MKKGFLPLGGKVLISRSTPQDKTDGGIILPDTVKEKPKKGVVKAVGPWRTLDDGSRQTMQVKEGQEVIFVGYAGNEIKMENQEYLVMDETDILGVIQ